MKRRLRQLAIVVVLVGIASWIPMFTSLGAHWIIEDQPPVKSDLIIVMGGDFWGPRVLSGVKLLRDGFAPKMIVSGPVYWNDQIPATPEGQLAIARLAEQGIDTKGIESFRINGGSTLDEIDEFGELLLRNKARSVLLVTSNYHSRRACLAFRLAWPTTRCTCIASPDPVYNPYLASQSGWLHREWPRLMGTMLFRVPLWPFRWLLALVQMP